MPIHCNSLSQQVHSFVPNIDTSGIHVTDPFQLRVIVKQIEMLRSKQYLDKVLDGIEDLGARELALDDGSRWTAHEQQFDWCITAL